jgi:cyclophilin family peptidyl-prolyl cis-trans isomerase
MWILLLPMLQQAPAERAMLEADHARASGRQTLIEGTRSRDPRVQQLAVRGLGRLEDTTVQSHVVPLLRAPDARVRRAAAGALAQMRAAFDARPWLITERDGEVRGAIYEAIGRSNPVAADAESLLVAGIASTDRRARTGAARGLESWVRSGGRTPRVVSPASLAVMQRTFAATPAAEFRQLVLLAARRTVASLRDAFPEAATDPDPQVRALAAPTLSDTALLVGVQAVRASSSCSVLETVAQQSEVLLAVVALERWRAVTGCATAPLMTLAQASPRWQIRTAALGTLAVHDGAAAKRMLPAFVTDTVWQVRAHAAAAAQRLRDTVMLDRLARDSNPNVALAAMRTVTDAVRGLRSGHAGLALTAAELLGKVPDSARVHLPRIVAAYRRLSNDGSMTLRDPRVALLQRMAAAGDTALVPVLREALADRDPAIARAAADALSQITGQRIAPETTTLPIPSLPSAAYIAGLRGAQAQIVMRGRGTIVVDLLTDDAPVTVATFAQLAEAGQYNGLTFHRFVPGFVIQGGSPGADEYDGRTREFMRDELGFARNARGTIGISTRGRDTGDGQIYFNLVDNVRLDRDYTVLARTRTGLDVMDRILEGDVIESVAIVRAATARR